MPRPDRGRSAPPLDAPSSVQERWGVVSGRRAREARKRQDFTASAGQTRAQFLEDEKRELSKLRAGFDGGIREFERAVESNPNLLVPLLIARADHRRATAAEDDDLLPNYGWRTGLLIGAADVTLQQLGGTWNPDSIDSEAKAWLWELRDGLDTYARICWCLRFGYSLAGVALARRYIERWTYNVAHSHGILKESDEDDVTYIRRVWRVYPSESIGRDVGADWALLSELLHGRAVTIATRQVSLQLEIERTARLALHNAVARISEIPLRQVRGAISVMVSPEQQRQFAFLQISPDRMSGKVWVPDFLSVFHHPLDSDFVFSKDATTYSGWGATYRRIVDNRVERELEILPSDSWMALEERWARAIDRARAAFIAEKSETDDYDPASLRMGIAFFKSISELTELASHDLPNRDHARALRGAATALESAWVLWLQDLDEALIPVRTALELTARARVHRMKPAKGLQMEASGRPPSPARWVGAAGWGRLAAFSRALGEFSHLTARSRTRGARSLLTAIQRNPKADNAAYTARGSALRQVASMLAVEVASTLEATSPTLAATLRSGVIGASPEESEARLVEWLDRAQHLRAYDFGEPDHPMPVDI